MNRGIRVLQTHALPLGYVTIGKKRRLLAKNKRLFTSWSGRRGSNSLPPPWQGGALPDELLPRLLYFSDFYIICNRTLFVKANSRKIFRSFPRRKKRGRPAPPSSLFSLRTPPNQWSGGTAARPGCWRCRSGTSPAAQSQCRSPRACCRQSAAGPGTTSSPPR